MFSISYIIGCAVLSICCLPLHPSFAFNPTFVFTNAFKLSIFLLKFSLDPSLYPVTIAIDIFGESAKSNGRGKSISTNIKET